MKVFEVRDFCDTDAFLQVYLREKTYEFVVHDKRPLMLICPGGGYTWTADREAEPVALAMIRAGFQACVLRYSVRKTKEDPGLGDRPLHEAASAIAYARAHAEEWGIDPQKITVCGFSAGGHLAGSIATLWNKPERTGVPAEEARPNAAVLCYGVLTAFGPTHAESIKNLTGVEGPSEMDSLYSPDSNVSADTVPVFIWHTAEDDCVPVESALKMACAMRKAGRPFALHIYTHGWHGLSLVTEEVGGGPAEAKSWFSVMLDWLESMNVGTGY
ncbi:MAG: alpha/beta hydrolase [Lachnospiraceae bacterium]|nr:alpha/beta hydrolase [Lachnospiraceae bacterium]